jgi:hypothetical protein
VSASRAALLVGLAASAALVVPAVADTPGQTDTTKTSKTTQTRDCGNGNSVFLQGPDTLWPPNHKMVNELAVAQSGSTVPATPLTPTTLTLTPTITDAAGGDGGPQHDPDVSSNLMGTGEDRAEVPFQARAERSGKGDGRTYTFNWTAKFNDGSTCSSDGSDANHQPFVIAVPHDQGRS